MTPRTAKRVTRLTDAQLEEVLALTKGADSVELKLTVPDSETRATVTSLGMDPLDAHPLQGQDHGGRGRRHARRLCLLGLLQGRPGPGPTWPAKGSTCTASSRPRPKPPSTTSPGR